MLDYSYFGIDNIQRNYILLTEAEVRLCSENGITVCSTNRAIFSTQVVNCEMSLDLQTQVSLCQKRLFLRYKTLTIICNNSVWVFNFPTRQKVALQCLKIGHGPLVLQLFGDGITYNAATTDFRTLPELLGRTSTAIETTHF